MRPKKTCSWPARCARCWCAELSHLGDTPTLPRGTLPAPNWLPQGCITSSRLPTGPMSSPDAVWLSAKWAGGLEELAELQESVERDTCSCESCPDCPDMELDKTAAWLPERTLHASSALRHWAAV
ncbi:hypothetical protein T440DRAFT_463303 [Plenodomus tracheiphilus IPT5]|uniref:Uncharacterized protein n=1 Tax=Plenodomus tracheiphilus IPT5 TaxID=1408161 RepID=A0A6A7BKB8_9PLEO|nr:hypothetical protein T440DRAFT_463303 [Plenodomus tracheiphilus IPT5]